MQLTYHQLVDIEQVIMNLKHIKDIPFKIKYKIIQIENNISTHMSFYQLEFSNLIEEYGAKNEDGQFVLDSTGKSIKILPEREEQCRKRIDELNNLTFNVDILFTYSEIDTLNEYLTLADIQVLYPLIMPE